MINATKKKNRKELRWAGQWRGEMYCMGVGEDFVEEVTLHYILKDELEFRWRKISRIT